MLGPNVIVTTVSHLMNSTERAIGKMSNSFEPQGRGSTELTAPVVIGNNVWIAAGTVICAGVSIGDNSVI